MTACGIAIGYAGSISLAFASHIWLVDANGHPIPFDFLVFWSAGRLVLSGHALAVFDPRLQHAAEVAAVGHPFHNVLPWPYPPLFLFVAATIASLPFVPAFLAWVGTTVTAQACVMGAIARRKSAILVALAPPWVFLGVLNGQNGFLTASIIGLVLLTLERRPIFSGALLGLLCYKPQLAMLFPLALAFGGYWRAFLAAGAATLLWTALSCAVFGHDTLVAFVHGLTLQGHTALAGGDVAAFNLQSLYGLALWLGAGAAVSSGAQACMTLMCAIGVILLWRSGAPFSLKAAGLASAIPLATPYIFVSDLAILSVAIAFLFRQRPFDRWEYGALAIAMTAVLAFILRTYPAGLFASLAIAAIVCRRGVVPRRWLAAASS